MILKKLEKILVYLESREGILLLISLGLTFLLRLPSLTEPMWYGDEGITFTHANTLRHSLSLYKDIFDNKPPLSYLLATFSFELFGPTQWAARVTLMIWVLVNQVFFFVLTRKLFSSKVAILSTFLFSILLSTPYIEGNIYNGEILMILPTTIGFLTLINRRYLAAGVLFGLATMFKIPAVLDLASVIAYLWVIEKKTWPVELSKPIGKITLGFIATIVLVSLPFILPGGANLYINSALLGNFSYTNYYNHFLITNGWLIIKGLPILALILYLKFRSKLDKQYKLILLWTVLSLFGAMLSGRPYTHYLIQVIPPFIILITLIVTNLKRNLVALSVAASVTLVITTSFELQSRGFEYYPNYLKFVTNQMDVKSYFNSFDPYVNQNYELAKFITERTQSSDKIFVWADQPQIYFLSERFPATRFVAYYHLYFVPDGFESQRNSVIKAEPKLIIKGKEGFDDTILNEALKANYLQTGEVSDAQIFLRKSFKN